MRINSKRTISILAILLIVISGLCAYVNSLSGKFVWDDLILVKDNIYIRSPRYISSIFRQQIGAGAGKIYNSYRPIQILSYMMDYSFWRLNEVGYHFTNLLLHILVAISIYWLIIIMFDDWLVALIASLFFTIHPIHTEAVAYISGRADQLATAFMLITFILYAKYLKNKKILLYILMTLSFIFALLSRENSLILPVLVLLYHFSFKKKINFKCLSTLLFIAGCYILMRFTTFKLLLPHLESNSSLFERLPGFFVALTNYLRLLLIPINLHMEYGAKIFKFGNPKAILGIVIMFLSLIYAFKIIKRNKLIFFGILWFFIALLPSSNIYFIKNYMAEHWLYLPSIGFFMIFAYFSVYLYRIKKTRIIAIFVIVGLLAFYTHLTIKQNEYWQNPIRIYKHTLKYAPDSPRVYNNLGNSYKELNEYNKAIDCYKKAIELDPNYISAFNNLAINYCITGRYDKGISLFKRAIEMNPYYPFSYVNLAIAYNNLGQYQKAIAFYKKAIELRPEYASAYSGLGDSYHNIKEYQKAIEAYKKAINIDPTHVDAYFGLGFTYSDINNYNMAINVYKKAIELNPTYAEAYNNLAVAYYQINQYNLAIKYCDKAKKLGFKVHSDFLQTLKQYR